MHDIHYYSRPRIKTRKRDEIILFGWFVNEKPSILIKLANKTTHNFQSDVRDANSHLHAKSQKIVIKLLYK